PGIVVIDDERQRAENGPPHPPRDPRQHLFLDPDDVELSRLDQIVQALGIEGEDAPERRTAAVIEFFQVDIVQERSGMDVDVVGVNPAQIMKEAHPATGAGTPVTRKKKDSKPHQVPADSENETSTD